MQAKKIVCFFSVMLLLFSGIMCSAGVAANPTATFSGGGVTVDLQYPEEAHPNTTITHNVTITSSTATTLYNFTVIIRVPVNSSWQEIVNGQDLISKQLPASYSLQVLLPQEANGTLQCFIFVNTSSIDDLSSTVYTTQVREMTYSELLESYSILNNTYNQLLTNYTDLNNTYTDLQSSYVSLNSSYNELLIDFSALNETHNQLLIDYNLLNVRYAALNSSYNELTANYDTLNNNYNDLESKYASYKYTSYDSLLANYNGLQSDFDLLNSTHYSLGTNFTILQTAWDTLNQTYTELKATFANLQRSALDSENALNVDKVVMVIFIVALVCLIVFIVYVKRKTKEPYVVIRKETVSMKQDEKS